MAEVIEGNAGDLASLVGPVFEQARCAAVNGATRAALERARDLLEQRRAEGFVRHCHGDLHLGNIVLLDGEPVLFDCLEFDEALASIDTFYDLAFLLMDLVHRDLRRARAASPERLSRRHLGRCRHGAAAPVPVVPRDDPRQGRGLRRAIRGRRCRGEIAAARAYLDLAQRFLAPGPPRLVAIGGVSGTGKSTLARALAPGLGAAPGAVMLRSDVIRKKLFGAAPTERLGPEAYREEVSLKVYDTLTFARETLLRAGHSVIVDAVFLERPRPRPIEQVAADAGVPFAGLWLTAPAETLMARVRSRKDDASDATEAVLQAQLEVDPGPLDLVQLDAGGAPDTVAASAREVLDGSARQ